MFFFFLRHVLFSICFRFIKAITNWHGRPAMQCNSGLRKMRSPKMLSLRSNLTDTCDVRARVNLKQWRRSMVMACPEPWHHTFQVKGYVSDHVRWLAGCNHCLQSVHLQFFVLGQTCPHCHSPERGFCCPILSSKIDRTCHYCCIPLKDSCGALCFTIFQRCWETQHCLGPSNLFNRRGFTWGWPNRHKSPRNQRKKRQELPRHQRPPRSLELIFCCRWYHICILYININIIVIFIVFVIIVILLLFLFLFFIAIISVVYRAHYHHV